MARLNHRRDDRQRDDRPARRAVRGGRLGLGALAAGVVGLGLWALGLFLDPQQAMYSYLAAFAFVLSVVLGVLIFSMLCRAMDATWELVVRRIEEAVIAALPALAVLFVPVVLGAGHIYPWAGPWAGPTGAEDPHLAHLLHHKEPYLDLPFFIGRAVVYFAVWILVGELLRRWSLATERRGAGSGAGPDADALQARGRALSAAMLPVVGLAVTFAAFDWLMSLQPSWFSSIYGLYFGAGCFFGGAALLTLLAHRARRARLSDELRPPHFHALGRVLLAFVVFWAYIAFFQAMLIRMADNPEEVTFYIRRISGSWAWLTGLLVLGHFALPFFLLLPKAIKLRSGVLAGLSVWLLLMHYVDMYWLVLPALQPDGAAPHWLDLVTLLGVGGMTVALAAWRQHGRSLLPEGHPRLERAVMYRSPLP